MQKISRQTMIDFVKQEAARGSIYVWGAQGRRGDQISIGWITQMETSTVNANRAISLWEKNCRIYDPDMIGAFDCSGLIGACLNANGNSGFDDTANGYLNRCVKIGKAELAPGDFVFEWNGIKSNHVGVYIGDGKVVEARGRDYGVVITGLDARNWKKFGRPDFMYEDQPQQAFVIDHLLKRRSPTVYDPQVQWMQEAFLRAGGEYITLLGSAGADGRFGSGTEKAVKRYQAAVGLNADGIVGHDTAVSLGATWEG